VVNQILPTRYCDARGYRKTASQAALKISRKKYFSQKIHDPGAAALDGLGINPDWYLWGALPLLGVGVMGPYIPAILVFGSCGLRPLAGLGFGARSYCFVAQFAGKV
jgi:hypothetical protein